MLCPYFTPISQINRQYSIRKRHESRRRQPFHDKRLYSTYLDIREQMVHHQSSVIQQIASTESKARSFYRFYANKKASIEELIYRNCSPTSTLASDKDLLCIGDSTSFNMHKHKKRVVDYDRFGVLQDGETAGFHAHVNLALDAADYSIVGLSDVILWQRSQEKKPNRHKTAKEKKESYKWYLGASNAKKVLSSAKSIHYIFDREADDFTLFSYIQEELYANFTIRAKHNRKVKFENTVVRLKTCLAKQACALVYETELRALDHYSSTTGTRRKRKKRKAKLECRFATVEVLAPDELKTDKTVQLSVVEVKEVTENLPEGEEPIHWILWSSSPIKDSSDLLRVIEYYLIRWVIEQLFRVMKNQGFQQENTQLGNVDAILKQTIMSFSAATTVMQLVQARDKQDAPLIDTVFDEKQQKVLNKVNEHVEGKTEKLKNPFPPDKLSYAAWIIARLGGWKGYKSQRPPGPITMKRGLDKFYTIYQGYQLFDST